MNFWAFREALPPAERAEGQEEAALDSRPRFTANEMSDLSSPL